MAELESFGTRACNRAIVSAVGRDAPILVLVLIVCWDKQEWVTFDGSAWSGPV
jgi:hypothetical protein